MNILTIVLLSSAFVISFLMALLVYKFCKHQQFQKKKTLFGGNLFVTKKKQSRKEIEFSLPVSYRTLKAQTPFLQNESYYKTDEKDLQPLMSRKVSSSIRPSIYNEQNSPFSSSVSGDEKPVETSPLSQYKDAPLLTTFQKKQRKISTSALDHLAKQGKRVSTLDLRDVTLVESSFEESQEKIEEDVFRKCDKKLSVVSSEDATDLYTDQITVSNTLIGPEHRRIADRRSIKNSGLPSHIHAIRTYKKSGKIYFSITHVHHEKVLHVDVQRVMIIGSKRDIADTHPFVQLYLIPGKKQKQTTKFQKATKEPVFNELIVFTDVEKSELEGYRLKLKVLSYSRLRKNDLLGEVEMSLGSIDNHLKESFNLDLFLKRSQNSLASLHVSLCHQATYNKLEVIVKEARNLTKSISSYVTLSLFRESSIERKDTLIKRNCRDPVYEESLEFNISTDFSKPLTTFTLVATINNVTLVGKDVVIGHVIFSLTSPQKSAADHWKRVQDTPHRYHSEWHSLIDPDEI
ncbi:synaptotagmin-7 isoform X1 [Hydra vulgaris]|uniref:Synaptotagmin-7 isoform X1 n=2 Tax=Hydra vulgaris TaxID=6087 RepID=A0ABM4CY36_HYDVU